MFISSVTGEGIIQLKDMLWRAINDSANLIEAIPITHRPLDGNHRVSEEDDFIFSPHHDTDDEDGDAPDAGGHMVDDWEYDDEDPEDEFPEDYADDIDLYGE
mgnify:FL=1